MTREGLDAIRDRNWRALEAKHWEAVQRAERAERLLDESVPVDQFIATSNAALTYRARAERAEGLLDEAVALLRLVATTGDWAEQARHWRNVDAFLAALAPERTTDEKR